MQEEIEHKTVNFAISTAKLSARTLLRGAQFFLRQYDKSASQGKQSMKRLIRQNRGVTNLEIEKTGIKDTQQSHESCGKPCCRQGCRHPSPKNDPQNCGPDADDSRFPYSHLPCRRANQQLVPTFL